jgi:hypothetical protein
MVATDIDALGAGFAGFYAPLATHEIFSDLGWFELGSGLSN